MNIWSKLKGDFNGCAKISEMIRKNTPVIEIYDYVISLARNGDNKLLKLAVSELDKHEDKKEWRSFLTYGQSIYINVISGNEYFITDVSSGVSPRYINLSDAKMVSNLDAIHNLVRDRIISSRQASLLNYLDVYDDTSNEIFDTLKKMYSTFPQSVEYCIQGLTDEERIKIIGLIIHNSNRNTLKDNAIILNDLLVACEYVYLTDMFLYAEISRRITDLLNPKPVNEELASDGDVEVSDDSDSLIDAETINTIIKSIGRVFMDMEEDDESMKTLMETLNRLMEISGAHNYERLMEIDNVSNMFDKTTSIINMINNEQDYGYYINKVDLNV